MYNKYPHTHIGNSTINLYQGVDYATNKQICHLITVFQHVETWEYLN